MVETNGWTAEQTKVGDQLMNKEGNRPIGEQTKIEDPLVDK